MKNRSIPIPVASFLLFLLPFFWFPTAGYGQDTAPAMLGNAIINGCTLTVNCTFPASETTAFLVTRNREEAPFVFPANENCPNGLPCETGFMGNVDITTSFTDSTNTTTVATFQYLLNFGSNQICVDPGNPADPNNIFRPIVTCTRATPRIGVSPDAAETYDLRPNIENLSCSLNNGQYQVAWSSTGCESVPFGDPETTYVTVENHLGESEQMSSPSNERNVAINSTLINLRYVTVVPNGNPDGMRGLRGICSSVNEPATEAPNRQDIVIHSAELFRFPLFTDGTASEEPGAINSGQSFRVRFQAPPSGRLSFATKLMQTNAAFLATRENGLPLFNSATGDSLYNSETVLGGNDVKLWVSGTELAQKPGVGSGQPLRGNQPVMEPDPIGTVRLNSDPYGVLPMVDQMVNVTISPVSGSENEFELLITNIVPANPGNPGMDGSFFPNPGCNSVAPGFSPGIAVVHSGAGNPLFTQGAPDYGEGLEQLAEDGRPELLALGLRARISVTGSAEGVSLKLSALMLTAIFAPLLTSVF